MAPLGHHYPSLLPAGAADFARRRAYEFLGLVLVIGAAALIAALISYNSADPSYNHATGTAPKNWLGIGGSYISELMIDAFGGVSIIPALALGGWGWRLIRRHTLDFTWLRITAAPLLMLTAAAAIAFIPYALPLNPTANAGPAGFVGDLMERKQLLVASALSIPFWILPVVFGVITIATLPLTLGVPWEDWKALLNLVWKSIHWLVIGSWRSVANLVGPLTAQSVHKNRMRSAARQRHRKKPKARVEPRLRPSSVSPTRLKEPDRVKPGTRETKERQGNLRLDKKLTELPPLNLLAVPKVPRGNSVDRGSENKERQKLLVALNQYKVGGSIEASRIGPVVTRHEFVPESGTRAARVIALSDDIARSMSRISARVAVIPGENAIGIELPNPNRQTVYLRELLGSADFENAGQQLPLALGKDIGGTPIVEDLTRMPHLLVAGTTGSGKSVAINSMILSLVYRLPPESCRLIMIDPKMLELSVYDGIPHLLHPVVTEPKKAVVALKWAVKEMNERYRLMSNLNVRNIAGYNKRVKEAAAKGQQLTRTVQTGFDHETGVPVYEEQLLEMEPLPLLVVVVDEMADLMLVAGKEIEIAVQSLAQKARAAGIHLIIATQRPSVDVITGTIKANLPTRISFQVTSKIDSRTILGEQGAEQLLGMGDMLYMAGGGQLKRVHGPFVSEDEVELVANFLRAQGTPEYLAEVTEDPEGDIAAGPGENTAHDELYDKAVQIVLTHKKASTSFIQRHLQIGYNRAARLVERMESEGIVSSANHVGKREILVPSTDI
ncbi:MAG: DNA translocase FtsK 4TM domain-containing protein [Pseudomonadota bacterium]|nr:DNA translocase FtsK 4TM domain-containing protein [Pseudomonadota bacterium]